MNAKKVDAKESVRRAEVTEAAITIAVSIIAAQNARDVGDEKSERGLDLLTSDSVLRLRAAHDPTRDASVPAVDVLMRVLATWVQEGGSDKAAAAFYVLFREYVRGPEVPCDEHLFATAIAHLVNIHNDMMTRALPDDAAPALWPSRQMRQLASVVGVSRARNLLTLGHQDMKLSVPRVRVSNHRWAAFLSDDEWERVREAIKVQPRTASESDAMSAKPYRFTFPARAREERRSLEPLSPRIAAELAASTPLIRDLCTSIRKAVAGDLGHGEARASVRRFATSYGIRDVPTLAIATGASERDVRHVLASIPS